jgi:glycosyltransferase involved in cell wall biosynthesis
MRRKKGHSHNSPLVSIIIPTYNRQELVARAIKSAQKQTYKNIEIIVVNDAGPDVGEIITSAADQRVKYVTHEVNKGLGAARNTGIKYATGEYLCFLDDDDYFFPYHIEILMNAIFRYNVKVVYSDASRAWVKDNMVYRRDIPYSLEYDYKLLLCQNITPVLCVLINREVLKESGVFDETLSVYEDWDLWIRIGASYKFKHIKKTTCEFTWKTDGTTMSSSRDGFNTLLPEIFERYKTDSIRVNSIRNRMLKERGL